MFALISNCSNALVDTGHCTKGGFGRDGELGKKGKKVNCVWQGKPIKAGENKGRRRRENGGPYKNETLKWQIIFKDLHPNNPNVFQIKTFHGLLKKDICGTKT